MATKESVFQAINRRIESCSIACITVLTAAGVAGLGVVDYVTGPEIAFSIFYLMPIYATTVRAGKRAGLVASVASAAVWGVADMVSAHAYSLAWAPVWNSVVRFAFFVVVTQLLSSLRGELERERELATVDSMTGLLNARAFATCAQDELDRCRRYRGALSLAYIDLDDFKSVNDRYGHQKGNEVLQAAGRCIGRTIRSTDSAARLGGDEFAILMPQADELLVHPAMERLCSSLGTLEAETGLPITFSIGVASFAEPPASVDEALKQADGAMYRAKREGKNRVVYEPRR